MRPNFLKAILPIAIFQAAVLLLGAGTAGAQQQVNLTAGPATITLPDGSAVPMWGYSCGAIVTGSTATCAKLNKNATGWSPVVITVPTGQSLAINLTNSLPIPPGATSGVPTSLMIVGQLGGGLGTARTAVPSPEHPTQVTTWPSVGNGPTFTPPAQGPRVQSFATEVPRGATSTLTWTTPIAGTYLMESGTHPSIQGPMGLYGMLVVTSAPTATAGVETAPGTAYAGVTYDAEIPLLLSEIDPGQNNAVNVAVSTSGFSEIATRGPTVGGAVAEVSITNPGAGYTTAPAVSFAGGGGTGAAATAYISNGQVSAILVTNGGQNYTSAPTVVLGGSGGAAGQSLLARTANSAAICSTPSGSVPACYPPAVNYTPLYYLINGVAFSKTNSPASLFPVSPANTSAATGKFWCVS